MKYFVTAMLLFVASFVSAQIVFIPDANFKQELVNNAGINTNADGEIQVSEAAAVTDLYLSSSIADLTGIDAFVNVQTLFLQTSQGSLQAVISMPRLKILTVAATINTLDLRGSDSLRFISLDLAYNLQLLNVSGLTLLDTINRVNVMGSLIARNCTNLKAITEGIGLSEIHDSLDVTGCTSLKSIYLTELGVSTLDLSTCTAGVSIGINGPAPRLTYLNFKNGAHDYFYTVDAGFANPVVNICADDFEITPLLQSIGYSTPAVLNISPYCTTFAGGMYNTIRGSIKFDMNNNGCDPTDAGMPEVPVRFADNFGNIIIKYTGYSGEYSIYTYTGAFTITPYLPYPYFNINPAVGTATFDTANNIIDTADFCITANGLHNDLEITLLPASPARPGFNADYVLDFKNRGTTVLSGNLQVNFDNSKVNFVGAYPTDPVQSTGQLSWVYNNLLPFEHRTIQVAFSLLPPPVNNVNDTLIFLAAITPVNADETPGDNSFILPQRVVGSYDPNSKECLEGSKIEIASLNKPLHYIIHFQNLGTDTAFNIAVTDTLSNNVDWESFDFITSSHPCHITRKNNKLEFYFENIKLPWQAINDAGSKGFVAFDVKPKNTLVVGDSVNNTASIYFDFNLPVRTNMASTVIVPSSPLAVKLEYFSVSKKDETNVLNWKAPSTNGSTNFEIERSADGIYFNNLGTITATTERCQAPFNYTDEKPLTGKNFYRLKITDADGHSFYSKILEIGNNRSGLEITAVTSDGNNSILYLNALNEQTVQLKIIATDGRIVYAQNKNVAAGNSEINLQLRILAKGVYSLVIYTSEGEIITKRFVN